MPDLVGREAAAQDRGSPSTGPGPKVPRRTSLSQTSAVVAGSSKDSAVTLTWYRPPPTSQSTLARSRRPAADAGVA